VLDDVSTFLSKHCKRIN